MKNLTRVFLASALALSLSIPAAAQAGKDPDGPLSTEVKSEVLSKLNDVIEKSAYVPGVDFSKWPDYLAKLQNDLEKAKNANEFALYVNNALAKFGTSHFVFNTPSSFKQVQTHKFVGIGIQPELVRDGLAVRAVFPGSPAEEAGLAEGDIIMYANDKKVTTLLALRGELGEKVRLRVRKTSGTVVEMTLTRREFNTALPESIKWVVPNEVALMKIPSFMTYDRQNVNQLFEKAKDAKALIIDLRNNGGGQVLHMNHLFGKFFHKDDRAGTFINRAIVQSYVKDKHGKETDLLSISKYAVDTKQATLVPPFPRGADVFEGRIVVLVNGATGSAAEIMAEGLKDVRNAKIIGTRSAGAVLASMMWPLPHGYMIQFPFQDYITMKGLRLEGHGVSPDIKADGPKAGSLQDPAIEAALKVLASEKVIAAPDKSVR